MTQHLVPDPAVPPALEPAPVGTAGAGVPAVIVVDADERTRASLVGLLAIRGRARVVGDAGTGTEAIALVKQSRPDVVVIDPRLPDLDAGLAVIRTIRSLDPDVRLLAMGPPGAIEAAVGSAGADGFVRKTFRPDELADAVVRCTSVIRSVIRTELPVEPLR